MPSSVVHVEALFYVSRETGQRIPLDLAALVNGGVVAEVSVGPDEIAAMRARFDPELRERIDRGEAEAIAYLMAHADDDVRFV